MDVVEIDRVLHRDRGRVPPAPADGNARVELVADVVVGHLVVAAVADPHADGPVMNPGGAVDDVVVADDVTGLRVRFGEVDAGLADHHAAAAQVVQPAALDAAVAASVAEPHAVRANVLDLAGLDGDLARAVGDDRRGDGDLRLAVGVARRRQHVLAVLEAQAPNRQVLDEPAIVGFAGDPHELVEYRGDHGGGCHVLVRPRQVRQRPVAVQEPLARLVQRRAEILQLIPAIGAPVRESPGNARRDDDGAGGRIGARQPRPRRFPGVIRHQRHVVHPLRRHGAQGFDVLDPRAERAVRQVSHLPRRRIDAPVRFGSDVVVELVGTPRPHRPAAVDPQLFEVPLACGDLGHAGGPDAVGAARETRDRTAAGESRRGVRRRLVADRTRGGAAVGRGEHQRLVHRVHAVGHHDSHRFGERCLGFEFADGVACAGQRGQRAVGLVGVGRGEPARPGIVAGGRHVQRGGERKVRRGKDQDHGWPD